MGPEDQIAPPACRLVANLPQPPRTEAICQIPAFLALAPPGGEGASWAGPGHPQPTLCDTEYLSH